MDYCGGQCSRSIALWFTYVARDRKELLPKPSSDFPDGLRLFRRTNLAINYRPKTFWPVIIIERWVYRRVCVYIAIHDSITTIMVSAFLIGWPAVYHTESNRKSYDKLKQSIVAMLDVCGRRVVP